MFAILAKTEKGYILHLGTVFFIMRHFWNHHITTGENPFPFLPSVFFSRAKINCVRFELWLLLPRLVFLVVFFAYEEPGLVDTNEPIVT